MGNLINFSRILLLIFSHRQAPFKFILLVFFISLGLETPRFFQFRLINNGTDFWTTALMEDPAYIQFSSYWDEMVTTGAVPLLALVYFNLCMILKIRASSKFNHRFVGRGREMPTKCGSTPPPHFDTGSDTEVALTRPKGGAPLSKVASVKVRLQKAVKRQDNRRQTLDLSLIHI